MVSIIILLISFIIQVIALVAIVKLIRFSRSRVSWKLIGLAFLLMLLSQLLEFYNYEQQEISKTILNIYHLTYLLISALMVLGIIGIGRYLRKIAKVEEERAESEKRFQFLFNNTSDEIFLADFEGNFIEVNQVALDRLGYSKEDLMNKNYKDIKTPKYVDLVNKNIRTIIKNGHHGYETEHVTKDNKVISLEMSSRVIDYFGRKAILSIARDITERHAVERKIAETIIETEDRERKRFAVDLHDGLAPLLSTIKLYTDLLKKGNLKKMTNEEAIQSIDELIDQAIISTKEISNNIMPSILQDFGLTAAIKDFCNYVNNTNSINIDLDTSQYVLNKTGIEEIVLFQAVKELVNNTIKHSEAKNVTIFLESHENRVNLHYTDDGIGFNVKEKLKEKSGLGLNNIVNKVQTIKGICLLKSKPGQGMSVLITIQINL
jgi:PAS domain S-box-containing protein